MFRGLPIVISCYFGDSVLAGMPGMLSAVLFFSSIDILLKGVKGALVDDLQETVEMAQGTLQFVRLNQVINITVPADQPVLVVIELADLEAPLREITGVAVGKRLLGAQSAPPGDDYIAVSVKKEVVFQEDTFRRNDAFSV